MAFDSVFMVLSHQKRKVSRISWSASSGMFLTRNYYSIDSADWTNIGSSAEITSMCSLDYYGIFLGLDSGVYMGALVPDVSQTTDASGNFVPV